MNDAQPDPIDSVSIGSQSDRPWWRNLSRTETLVTAIVVGAFLGAYAPNLIDLVKTWIREPDYSHGFLVLPIALVIMYRLWPQKPSDQPTPWMPGLLVVVLGLGLRVWFHNRGQNWSETATLLIVIFGLGLSRLGGRTIRSVWPAFAFLVFLLPLPTAVNNLLSQPLQGSATWAACKVLRITGLWVMPEGNVIVVGGERLEVAAACNGLSMLMSLAATVAATAILVPMTLIKRLVLLATIIPIALVSNILRISATAWCYYQFGAAIGSRYAHDAAGWLMMPTAMVFVGLELLVMSWLIVESRFSVNNSLGSGFAPVQPEVGR